MLVKVPHGGYLEEKLKFVWLSNVSQMAQCTIPSTELNNPGNNIKAIYPIQKILYSFNRSTLFGILCQNNSLVLSAKIL